MVSASNHNPAVPGSSLLWPLSGFVLSHPEFKSSTMVANSKLVASYQLGFLIVINLYLNYLFLRI